MGKKSLKERLESGEVIASRSTYSPKSFDEAFKMMACRFFVEFCLEKSPPLTRAEVADAIGVSELQMRQILAYRIELFDVTFLIEKLDRLKESHLGDNTIIPKEIEKFLPKK
jgi:hypothetical protein